MALFSSLVLACAVCGAAEQTLPTNGAEVPFDGRKRATLELRAASFETRDRALRVAELRAQPGFAMAIGRDALLGADVPLLRRSIELATDPSRASGESAANGVGDAEVRGSYVAWRSVPSTINRRFTLLAGVKLPTAKHTTSGRSACRELQHAAQGPVDHGCEW